MQRFALALIAATMIALASTAASAQDARCNCSPSLLPSYSAGMWGQPISTPIMDLNGTNPVLEVGARNATDGNIAGAENATVNMAQPPSMINYYSLYYGYGPVMAVNGEAEEASASMPQAGGFRMGLGRFTTIEQLHYFGYGLPLGDAAREAKARRRPAKRVYTNADVERLAVKQ